MTKSSTTPIVAEFGPSVQEYSELELEQLAACRALCSETGQCPLERYQQDLQDVRTAHHD